MRSNAWTIFRLNAATRGNKLIYWLGRLPLLRRVFTDRLYAAGEGKFALFLLQNLWWVLKAIAGKVIYLAVLLLIAAFVALDGVQDTLTALGITALQAGGIATAFYVGYVASNFFSGFLIDVCVSLWSPITRCKVR